MEMPEGRWNEEGYWEWGSNLEGRDKGRPEYMAGLLKVEARLNNAHIKQPCVSCDVWDRPGDAAYFVDSDWVCDACAEGGVECVRAGLREQAARFRRIADNLESDAAGEIEIIPLSREDRELLEEREREYEQMARRVGRRQSPFDEFPFPFDEIPF
jgi:hypothetical protein